VKHYLDFGAHFGEGYERIKELVGIDDDWNVCLFEPNPLCYGVLLSKEHNAKIFTLAVADVAKITGFDLQKCSDGSNFALDGFGSSLTGIGSTEKGLGGSQVNVMCLPMSSVIDMCCQDISELHIKIDIEGAEYFLDYDKLPKHCLVYLYIEWHGWGCADPIARKAEILANLPLNVVATDWD
jgi:FkbM family methyltransferase